MRATAYDVRRFRRSAYGSLMQLNTDEWSVVPPSTSNVFASRSLGLEVAYVNKASVEDPSHDQRSNHVHQGVPSQGLSHRKTIRFGQGHQAPSGLEWYMGSHGGTTITTKSRRGRSEPGKGQRIRPKKKRPKWAHTLFQEWNKVASHGAARTDWSRQSK